MAAQPRPAAAARFAVSPRDPAADRLAGSATRRRSPRTASPKRDDLQHQRIDPARHAEPPAAAGDAVAEHAPVGEALAPRSRGNCGSPPRPGPGSAKPGAAPAGLARAAATSQRGDRSPRPARPVRARHRERRQRPGPAPSRPPRRMPRPAPAPASNSERRRTATRPNRPMAFLGAGPAANTAPTAGAQPFGGDRSAEHDQRRPAIPRPNGRARRCPGSGLSPTRSAAAHRAPSPRRPAARRRPR